MSKAIETYLREIAEIRATGAGGPEASFYPAVANLLNGVGAELKPKVLCVFQLRNRGGGMPDAGLFTADQLRKRRHAADDDPWLGQLPSRGVIEIKAPGQDLPETIDSEQVGRYWNRYGLVLVTNLRAFAIVGRNAAGQPTVLERCTLADSESAFWDLVAHPHSAADRIGQPFAEYLRRVLLHNAPLARPQDVATILASYARDARARVEHAELPALDGLRKALEDGLGMRFEGAKGDHFFRSTLVQTLFYGVFSAWVLWARRREKPVEEKSYKQAMRESASEYTADPKIFDWRIAQWLLRVPMIRGLFAQVADPARLGALGLIEVLDWTAAALNRVDRAAFFAAFDEGHAVQYFYEPFLEAFDPELRKELGVWYTPSEIVDYQVERVDTVLREELGIADGLADPRVVLVDPCCGTAAYVRAALRRIARTLAEKGGDALVAQELKKAAMERVFGFEILPAPFVVAHLQIVLLLESLGAPLSETKMERAGIYLTNALTGWEPPKEPKTLLLFPELAEERDAADKVKREARILVVIGNPPYNGYAGVALEEERALSDAYRTTRRAPAPQGQGLNDLYVRFFRMAERRIVEMNQPAAGVVCFISNYSWLDGLSFTGMRERYLECFDRIWIDCLNGDKYKTGKLTPDGDPDPSVFSTDANREGIQVGTAITLLVRTNRSSVDAASRRVVSKAEERGEDAASTVNHTRQDAASTNRIHFRHLWGKTKREQLLQGPGQYQEVMPVPELGLSFMPGRTTAGYTSWPLLPELFPVSFPGVKTSRDDFVVDVDRTRLLARMQDYFNQKIGHDELRQREPSAMTSTQRFQAEEVRSQLLKRGFLPNNLVRYCYRPFDMRWLYWEPTTKLLDEKRSDYFPHVGDGNVWIEARQRQTMEGFDRGYFVRVLADNFGNGLSNFFPLYLHAEQDSLLATGRRPNLSDAVATYLAELKATPEDLFYHTLAVLHAPAYRTENSGALRQDWPRVPLPGWGALSAGGPTSASAGERTRRSASLQTSAALGRRIAALLDTDTPVPGVTSGKIRPELKEIGLLTHVDGKHLDPDAGDLDLTAGWGHAGKGGVTMPGKGRSRRSEVGGQLKAESGEQRSEVGGQSLDVFLNANVYWRNIPQPVWEYTLGGYQVIKKWLSYREKPLLGRPLTVEETRYVTEMARRIAVLVGMAGELDGNYALSKTPAANSAGPQDHV